MDGEAEKLSDEDFTPKKQKEYMDNLIRDLMKDGMKINDIMDMTLTFVMELMEERNKPKKEQSLISAFAGGYFLFDYHSHYMWLFYLFRKDVKNGRWNYWT